MSENMEETTGEPESNETNGEISSLEDENQKIPAEDEIVDEPMEEEMPELEAEMPALEAEMPDIEEEPPDIEDHEVPDIEAEPCRLCDEIGEKMFNIFDDNPEGYQLIGLIKENLPIVLYKSDPLSKQICDKCVLNLQIISSLKKRSRKTQEKYVEKLKTEGDTSDKNILLFLGCTGSKLIDNGEEEEEEEEELKDKCTSTEDLTILCCNCKTAILDASTVNGEIELSSDLHKAIAESLRKNRVITEKELRKRKVQPIYQELDDSLCSSLTDLSRPPGGEDDISQYDGTDVESEESNEERPAKRKKLDTESKKIQKEIDAELAKTKQIEKPEDAEEEENENEEEKTPEDASEKSGEDDEKTDKDEEKKEEKTEEEKVEEKFIDYEEMFKKEPEFTYEPLTLLQSTINCINLQNVPDFESLPYYMKPSACACSSCGEQFQNVKLLALHEPEHMSVDVNEKIDHPEPWPADYPYAIIRNKWLTFFDENGYDEEDIVVDNTNEIKEDASLLVENTEKTAEMSKKDEVYLVNMKPMVNGMYLGDYTKEERKAFYQCIRIGGQTKRYCPLCRYCFKDNWAIESHYFSLACHYTCRYCGMRFNKQRHRFDDHIKEHKKKEDKVSEKIFTASKLNNSMPKIIQPDKVKRINPGEPEKPREIRLEDYAQPPIITKGGFDQRSSRYANEMIGQTLVQTPQGMIKIKEEPKDSFGPQSNKPQNQAYFCRKCYKVFFKLDEFNAHSKNCDYNQYPTYKSGNGPKQNQESPNLTPKQSNNNSFKGTPPSSGERRSNGEMSSAGRPIRNCVKDIGPYKDEVYIPKQLLNDVIPNQNFVCHICKTPFPTIYSRNSHMRIHKGEPGGPPGPPSNNHQFMVMNQNILKQRLQQQQHSLQVQRARQMQEQQKRIMLQQRQQQQQNEYPRFEEIKIKQEPVDIFEPMVEIHGGHEQPTSPPPPQNYPSPPPVVPRELGGGAVSLTPIQKKPQKPNINPDIMKLVQNNPNISISKKPSERSHQNMSNGSESRSSYGGGSSNGAYQNHNARGSAGYQGPYAPQQNQQYISVSNNLMPPNAEDNRTYKCSSCWEAFSNKSHLYFHKKNQCEGSRFPCPFCKKRFGTEAAYSSHIFYSHPE